MEFEGTAYKILEPVTGTSAKGDWHRQDVVFDMMDGSYSRKVCVKFFNKQNEIANIKEGQQYKISINLESREYNGRWYSDINAWRIQPMGAGAPAAAPTAAPVAAPTAAPVAAPTVEAAIPASDIDDMPF